MQVHRHRVNNGARIEQMFLDSFGKADSDDIQVATKPVLYQIPVENLLEIKIYHQGWLKSATLFYGLCPLVAMYCVGSIWDLFLYML